MINRRILLTLLCGMFSMFGAADIAQPVQQDGWHQVGPFYVETDREAEGCRDFMERYPRLAAKLPERFEDKNGTALAAGVEILDGLEFNINSTNERVFVLGLLKRLGIQNDLDLEESGILKKTLSKGLMRFIETRGRVVPACMGSYVYFKPRADNEEIIAFPIEQLPAPGQTATAVSGTGIVRIEHIDENQYSNSKMFVVNQITFEDPDPRAEFFAIEKGEFNLAIGPGRLLKIPVATIERMFRGERVAILGSCNNILKAIILEGVPTDSGFKYRITQAMGFGFGHGQVALVDKCFTWMDITLSYRGGGLEDADILQRARAFCSIDANGNLVIPMCCAGQLVIKPEDIKRSTLENDIFVKPEGCFADKSKYLVTYDTRDPDRPTVRIIKDSVG